MMVERVVSTLGVSEIMSLRDERLEKRLPCTKGEWIQWLMTMIGKEDFLGLWLVRERERSPIRGYVVAINSVAPPISDSALLLYSSICNANSEEANRLAIDAIVEWAKSLGIKKISLFTDHPELSSSFGFVKVDGVPMVLEVE